MKIVAIGRNYAEHIAELKNEVPDEPVIFLYIFLKFKWFPEVISNFEPFSISLRTGW